MVCAIEDDVDLANVIPGGSKHDKWRFWETLYMVKTICSSFTNAPYNPNPKPNHCLPLFPAKRWLTIDTGAIVVAMISTHPVPGAPRMSTVERNKRFGGPSPCPWPNTSHLINLLV